MSDYYYREGFGNPVLISQAQIKGKGVVMQPEPASETSLIRRLQDTADGAYARGVTSAQSEYDKNFRAGQNLALESGSPKKAKDESYGVLEGLRDVALGVPSFLVRGAKLAEDLQVGGARLAGGIIDAVSGTNVTDSLVSVVRGMQAVNLPLQGARALGGLQESYADKDSVAYNIGDYGGELASMVAGGAGLAKAGIKGAKWAVTPFLHTTVPTAVGVGSLNALFGAARNNEAVEEGKMSATEAGIRAGTDFATGAVLSGAWGRITGGTFNPLSWGKQIAADAAGNAAQSLVGNAAVDVSGVRDITAKDYALDAGLSAGLGAGIGLGVHTVQNLPGIPAMAQRISDRVRGKATGEVPPDPMAAGVAADPTGLTGAQTAAESAYRAYGDNQPKDVLDDRFTVPKYANSADLPKEVKKVLIDSDLLKAYDNLTALHNAMVGGETGGAKSVKEMVDDISRVYQDPNALPANMDYSKETVVASDEIAAGGIAKDSALSKAMAAIEVSSYATKVRAAVGDDAQLQNAIKAVIAMEERIYPDPTLETSSPEKYAKQKEKYDKFMAQDVVTVVEKFAKKRGVSEADFAISVAVDQSTSAQTPSRKFLFENKFSKGMADPGNAPAQSDTPPQDVPPQDVPPQDVPPQDVPPQDVPPQDVPPQDVPPQDVPPQDVPPQDVPPQDVPPQDVPPQDVPPQDVPPQDVPPQDVPPQDVPPAPARPPVGTKPNDTYAPDWAPRLLSALEKVSDSPIRARMAFNSLTGVEYGMIPHLPPDNNEVAVANAFVMAGRAMPELTKQQTIAALEALDSALATHSSRRISKQAFKNKIKISEDMSDEDKQIYYALVDALDTDTMPYLRYDKRSTYGTGSYNFSTNLMVIGAAPPAGSLLSSANTLVHEIGHFIYRNILTTADRVKFAEHAYDNIGFMQNSKGKLATAAGDALARVQGERVMSGVLPGDAYHESNFQEYFAEQFKQWFYGKQPAAVDGAFSAFAKSSTFDSIVRFVKRVKELLLSRELIDENLADMFERATRYRYAEKDAAAYAKAGLPKEEADIIVAVSSGKSDKDADKLTAAKAISKMDDLPPDKAIEVAKKIVDKNYITKNLDIPSNTSYTPPAGKLSMNPGQYVPGAAALLSQTLDDEEEYGFGAFSLTGREIKNLTMFGASMYYGNKIRGSVLPYTLNLKINESLSSFSSVLGKMFHGDRPFPPFLQTSKSDLHSKKLAEAGYREWTEDKIHAFRKELDKRANKGLSFVKGASEGLLMKRNDFMKNIEGYQSRLKVAIAKNRYDADNAVTSALDAMPTKMEKNYAKAMVILMDKDIADLKQQYPGEVLDAVIDHYKNVEVENRYFQGEPEKYMRFKSFQEANDKVRLVHAQGLSMAITGEDIRNFEAAKKVLTDGISSLGNTVQKMQEQIDDAIAQGQGKNIVDTMVAQKKKAEFDLQLSKDRLDLFNHAQALSRDTVKNSYFSRWHGEVMPYYVRVTFSPDDPGLRVGFRSNEEAEAFAARYPNALKVEKIKGQDELAEKAADREWVNQFFKQLISTSDPDAVVSKHQLSHMMDALDALGILKNKKYLNEAMGRDVVAKDGKIIGDLSSDELGKLYRLIANTKGNPFEFRENVQGYMPVQDIKIKDPNKRYESWLENMAEHYDTGKDSMLDYYDRAHYGVSMRTQIDSVQKQLMELQVGDRLYQWLEMYKGRMNLEGAKTFRWAQPIVSAATVKAMWLNDKAALTNMMFGHAATAEEAIAQYGFRLEYALAPKDLFSAVSNGKDDVAETMRRLNEYGLLSSDFVKSIGNIEKHLPFTKLIKGASAAVDAGMSLQKGAEFMNNYTGALIAVRNYLDSHPGDIEGAMAEAWRFNKSAQGRYSPEAQSQLEYATRNIGFQPLFVLVSPAIRNMERVAANIRNTVDMSNPNKARYASSLLLGLGTATFIAGVQGIPGFGDMYKLALAIEGFTKDKDEQTTPNKESATEQLRRWSVNKMMEAGGFTRKQATKIASFLEDGGMTMLTGRNFTNDASVQGMATNPVVFSLFKDYKEAAEAFAQNKSIEQKAVKIAESASVVAGRAARAYHQMMTGEYTDSQGESLYRDYAWGDAIKEILAGRTAMDYKALQRDFAKGGEIYSEQDGASFASSLQNILGLKFSKGHQAELTSSPWAASEFRFRMLNNMDGAEASLKNALKIADKLTELNKDAVVSISRGREMYGKNGVMPRVKTGIRESVTNHYLAIAVIKTYMDMGMTPPAYKYLGYDDQSVVVEYLTKKTVDARKKEIDSDRFLDMLSSPVTQE